MFLSFFSLLCISQFYHLEILLKVLYTFIQRHGASVDLQGILLGPSGFQGKWELVKNGEGFKAEEKTRLFII